MNRLLVGAFALVTMTACGAVKLVAPPGAEDASEHTSGPATAWLSSCAVLEKAEVDAALGVPADDPVWYLGTDENNVDGNSCIWKAGRAARISTWVDGRTHGPELDEKVDGAEKVEGIGRSAYVTTKYQNTAEVYSHTAQGLGFFVVVGRPGIPKDVLRTAAIDLATKVAERLTTAYPGTPDAIVRPPHPAPNPCHLLPAADRVAALGWAAGRDSDTQTPATLAEPRVGGPGGAGWSCYFWDWGHQRYVHVDLSSGAVADDDARADAVPITEPFPRPAFYRERIPASEVTGWVRDSEITVILADGRAVTIRMNDDEADDPTHRARLMALARVALGHFAG